MSASSHSTSETTLLSASRPRYAAQTLDRGLAILGCFSAATPRLSARDLGERLGWPPSTLYRYLATLEAAGFLQREPHTGLYRPGLRLVELAGIVLNQLEVRLHALPELDALADEVGLNANLAILFEGDTFHIGYAIRASVPRMYTTLGRRAVAHCTALGKCLLAGLPRAEVHALIREKGWRPYTPHSIQDFARLDRELDAVAAQGYAIDREERALGQWCVAAPVRDRTGQVVAAISVTGPKERFQGENLARIITAVTRRAARISYRLGYEPLLAAGLW